MRFKTEKLFILMLLITVAALFQSPIAWAQISEETINLHFFGTPHCGKCMGIKEEILFPLRDQHPLIRLNIHNIDSDEGFALLMKMERKYRVKDSSAIMLFTPSKHFSGADSINAEAREHILSLIKNAQRQSENVASAIVISEESASSDDSNLSDISKDSQVSESSETTDDSEITNRSKNTDDIEIDDSSVAELLRYKFQSFSLTSIILAGIVDGINPCAIATMIFLISFLASQKRSRREVLVIGLSFTFAVFVTYLLLGVGAFKLLSFLTENRIWSQIIKWSAVIMAAGIGIFSFIDAFRFKHSHNVKDIKLQLPKAVKLRIHKTISGHLNQNQLVAGALITGFLVTLLEAVCTGQVYLPTIILMTRQDGLRLTGWMYLIIYNILFVLPLLIVMMAAYYGLKWDKLAHGTQKHMVGIKVIFGIVLIALAIFLALAS